MATPGVTYYLQYKVSLQDPVWKDLAGAVTATGIIASKEDPIRIDGQCLYRVRIVHE
jgi:hypothetical protein